MARNRFSTPRSLTEEESSVDQNFLEPKKVDSPTLRRIHDAKVLGLLVPCCQKKKKVSATYDELQTGTEKLEVAKSKILSYTPGSWMSDGDCLVPDTTCILLIGPKGSGKTSLVNKISRFFEHDKLEPERAPVSNSSSIGGGTYFLHEYPIPRGSHSFCLYDTRCLSDDSIENMRMLGRWLTKGVRHGELVERASYDENLEYVLEIKACESGRSSGIFRLRMVNFVIMVVNGISVLESLDTDDVEKKQYVQMVETIFLSPLLSFKGDKPVVVVTHGDLLTLDDRFRIRVYLEKLLGVHPNTKIFDIPESDDPGTNLAIVDLLIHCLECADRNLPVKSWFMRKIHMVTLCMMLLMFILAGHIITM